MGEGFTTNAKGSKKFTGKSDSITLSGEDSIIGKYLQLNNKAGEQAACCLIELSEHTSISKTKKKNKNKKDGKSKNGDKNKNKNGDKKKRDGESETEGDDE